MPEVDGYQAAREIRALEEKRGNYPPIFALTAYSTVEFRARATEAGMDIYLTKPVNKSNLLKAIARAMALKKEKVLKQFDPSTEKEDSQ